MWWQAHPDTILIRQMQMQTMPLLWVEASQSRLYNPSLHHLTQKQSQILERTWALA